MIDNLLREWNLEFEDNLKREEFSDRRRRVKEGRYMKISLNIFN
jgi:hypothetical protein